MAHNVNNTKLKIERCTAQNLLKYGITEETILQCEFDSFWNDPGFNYFSPFDIDKEKRKSKSIFALTIASSLGTYTSHSIEQNLIDADIDDQNINITTKRENPYSNSFLCLIKTTKDDIKDNNDKNNINNNSINTESSCDYDFAGTLSLWQPVSLGRDSNSIGFHTLLSLKHQIPTIIAAVRKYKLSSFLFGVLYRALLLDLNEELIFRTITKNYLSNGMWLMEPVCVSNKYQRKGIGSWFIKNIFKENQSIISCNGNMMDKTSIKNHDANNYKNGFVMLFTMRKELIPFYKKVGYKLLTQMDFPQIINESGKIRKTTQYFFLWHENPKILQNMIEEMRKNENNAIKSIRVVSGVFECVKILHLPNWLQWLTFEIAVVSVLFVVLVITSMLAHSS